MSGKTDKLSEIWACGYSVAELWGMTRPVQRATSEIESPYILLWGILSIAEQQVDRGMGHRYFRERLASGDWRAIGYLAPRSQDSQLCYVPVFPDAKFGRKESAIGDGIVEYVDVRVVNAGLLELLSAGPGESSR